MKLGANILQDRATVERAGQNIGPMDEQADVLVLPAIDDKLSTFADEQSTKIAVG